MHIEVDQSGNTKKSKIFGAPEIFDFCGIEQLNMDTVIAFSNKNQYSVLISKEVKQQTYRLYKGKIKDLRYRLFCIGVYYCLKDYIKENELITICCEYIGKENLIKSFLLDYFRRQSAVIVRK